MTGTTTASTAAGDTYDGLIAGLIREFGSAAAAGLAHDYLAAEAADFRWAARNDSRALGRSERCDDDGAALERVAIIGTLAGCWFTAIAEVDEAGGLHDVIAVRQHAGAWDAHGAFAAID